jgi:hypothetical protein
MRRRGSQHISALDLADRLWKRLGGTGSAFDSDELPPMPPYMHWRTYRRLEAKYEELLNRWAVSAAGSVGIVHPDESGT